MEREVNRQCTEEEKLGTMAFGGENRGVGRQWTEEEVKALLAVWSEKDIQHCLQGATRNKAIFIYISNRLQRLNVFRDWKQCRAKYKNLKHEYRSVKINTDDPAKFMKFFQELDTIMATDFTIGQQLDDDDEEEEEGHGRNVKSWNSEKTNEQTTGMLNKGSECLIQKPPLIPSVAADGGKHWTDEEVHALLYIWADPQVQDRLQGALRNKSIFQEIAKKLQRFGVQRDWKQCRTKYKNLKYDYKSAKSSGAGYLGKTMKFYSEVEAILEGRAKRSIEEGHADAQATLGILGGSHADAQATQGGSHADAQATLGILGGSHADAQATLGILGGSHADAQATQGIMGGSHADAQATQGIMGGSHADAQATLGIMGGSHADAQATLGIMGGSHADAQATLGIMGGSHADAQATLGIMGGSHGRSLVLNINEGNNVPMDGSLDQPQMTVLNDGGRNWSDEEVRALLHIWSEGEVQQRLERSTRNKEIFVQISGRLLHLGIDRDWKQCRTKYKNLKYSYRALQRRQGQRADPRRVMKFYDEVDAILKKPSSTTARECILLPPLSELHRASISNTCTDHAETVGKDEISLNRRLKRKALDKEICFSKRGLYREETKDCTIERSLSRSIDRCKEEADQYVPIIQIDSVYSMASVQKQEHRFPTEMASAPELKLGKKLNEGKTKEIYELSDQPGRVLVQSKDQITAGNAVRKDQMEGKAAIANRTTCSVFRLLQEAGIKTAFVQQHTDTAFVAAHCEMIPIEWVCRRVATGSFLKRNPGVKEGYRFSPVKMEMFFKDDANNDPQWSEEQLIEAKFCFAGLDIGRCEVDIMNHSTVAIFEILEKAWGTLTCTLVDMKIEFGVNVTTKEIVLADVIDNDSWRLWPSGDRSQQKDKQVYRDLKEVTPEAMQLVKRNFEWVSERVKLLLEPESGGRVVVLMGSTSDLAHCERIRTACALYGIPCVLRVTSAHKGPDETLQIKAQYEGDGVPTVFVAVAGRSNGLGPVMSGNTAFPVINCPPLTPDWGAQDVWSSLRMPSGLACSTVLSPDAAAQFAAQILGLNNHLVWAKLRASMLNTWVSLKLADQKLQACNL